MNDIIKPFLEWAGKEGYDTAHTYDTDRSQWVVFNPMTADLWKAYQAGGAPMQAENEALRKEIAEIPVRSFCAPAYATLDLVTMGRNDPMYSDALELIEKHQKYSVSLVQRHLRISYNRAAFMVDHAKEDAARAKEQT